MVSVKADLDMQLNDSLKMPLVSISCLAFNHVQYIRVCLDSFLMQKTSFAFEIIIHDDASTDGTKEIIEEYATKYPDIIFPIYQKENQYSKGIKPTWVFNAPRWKGKYIALCEGDDYWTDPLKLQKQVDFLETNSDYVMCTHATEEKNEIMNTSVVFPKIGEDTTKYIEDYIINNLTATCSLMFKAAYLEPIPEWFKKIQFGDLGLILMLFYRSNKKMMVLKDCMAVYRINSGSIHGSLKNNNASLIKAYKMHLDFIDTIDNELFLKKKFKKVVVRKKINTHSILADLYKNSSTTNYYKHLFKKFLLTRFKC